MNVVRYVLDVIFKAIVFLTIYIILLAIHCAI